MLGPTLFAVRARDSSIASSGSRFLSALTSSTSDRISVGVCRRMNRSRGTTKSKKMTAHRADSALVNDLLVD